MEDFFPSGIKLALHQNSLNEKELFSIDQSSSMQKKNSNKIKQGKCLILHLK